MKYLTRFLWCYVLIAIASSLAYVKARTKRRNKFPMPPVWIRYAKGVIENEGCVDKRSDCDGYAFPEYCSTYWGFMLKYCRKSCNFCDAVNVGVVEVTTQQLRTTPTTSAQRPTTPGEPTTPGDCEDVLDDCKRYITNPKYCLSNLAFMNKYCRKTCQLCPTTAPPVCQNQLPDCDSFITSPDQCDSNIRGFYWKYCAKACSLCRHTKPSITRSVTTTSAMTLQPTTIRTKPLPLKPTDECRDVLPGCASMVNENDDYCEYQKKFMKDFCAKTCQFCGRTEPGHREKEKNGGKKQPQEGVCTDRRPKKCKFYASFFKYCKRNKHFMTIHCPKSCNFCKKKEPTKKPMTKKYKTFNFAITKQWNGDPINHKPIHFRLKATKDFRGVKFHVRGPLFNDPKPPPCPSGEPCWKLWDYEVAEIFFLGMEEKYLEVEVSPHGQHLVLLLNGVRKPFKTMLRMSYKAKKHKLNKQWSGTAIIPMEYFPPGIGSGKMNAHAIHGSGSNRTYESLYPASKNASSPDFHRLDLFKPFDFKAMFPPSWTQPASNYWKLGQGAQGAK